MYFSSLFPSLPPNIAFIIFKFLDPLSLHVSRQVCVDWNLFVRECIWGSNAFRKLAIMKVNNNWTSQSPRWSKTTTTKQLTLNYPINTFGLLFSSYPEKTSSPTLVNNHLNAQPLILGPNLLVLTKITSYDPLAKLLVFLSIPEGIEWSIPLSSSGVFRSFLTESYFAVQSGIHSTLIAGSIL